MRVTPRILEYRVAVTISRCGQSAGKADRKSEPSETARRAPTQGASDDDTVHAPWRHGENVNKVSVGEPADGSPPRTPSSEGGLGKVERASASRSRASNPLLFGAVVSARSVRSRYCGVAPRAAPREFLRRASDNL